MFQPMITDQSGTDRGMSIAVTHVLTIGITTILIALLVTSSAAMLDTETDRSADRSLEAIGERLAGEIANVDAIANESDENVTLTTEHPRTVAGSSYRVELLTAGSGVCGEAPLLTDETDCLRLTASSADVEVYVPLKVDVDVDHESSASGGLIEIRYEPDPSGGSNDKITIESGNT
ncbi:hypothetical protein ACFO5R_17430 [Halosolutus amylolyticus]|uniref:Flagellin n=1 Tax=Halosolutus amylolyticus TaxID=2932267 RepID=A0ABD5PSY3_9EURY|nr:hypothetical protein [Halosolutus amylolyticus]